MARNELYLDRARAESFGPVAAEYDRFRPSYPDALMDDLASSRPASVLDVACGTGKVAVALAARGLRVLGVELDARMAGVARGHGIEVEVGAFESWDDGGRRFDLLTCGAGWHWIDPRRGLAKAATVLRPGGTIGHFWSYDVLDDEVRAALEAVYARCAPELEAHGSGRTPGEADDFAGSDAFTAAETRDYRWDRTLSAAEWVGRVATYSDHQRLGGERLAALQRALHEEIERLGGSVVAHSGTHVRLARRV